MIKEKRLRICRKCSGVDIEKLKELIPREDFSTGCIGKCNLFDNKVYGYLEGTLTVCDSEDEFLEKIVKMLVG